MWKKTAIALISLVISLSSAMPSGFSFAETQPPATETIWTVSHVPADDWNAFFLHYQRFLRERLPRAVRNTNDKARDRAARIHNHRELAALLEKFSEVCNTFAHSDAFPAFADPAIPKEDKNKIPGTWNLYRDIPPSAADLWQEACHLRFLALLHASEVDFDALARADEYAEQIAEYETLQKPYRQMKRVWYVKTLGRIMQYADRANVPCDDRLNEQNAGPDVFAGTIRDFRTFLSGRFDRENVELLEFFVTVAEKCETWETDELLRQLLDEAETVATDHCAAVHVDPTATPRKKSEAAELLEWARLDRGMFRRHRLIGQELQIRGHDVNGNVFDATSLEGQVVLLDFWATWCAPCVAEFPHWKTLYEKYHTRGFEIVGYNVDTDMERLAAFLEKNPLPWPVLVREQTLEKGEPPLSTFYGAKKLPVVILRDRQGKVVLLDARGTTLEETLERLFAE